MSYRKVVMGLAVAGLVTAFTAGAAFAQAGFSVTPGTGGWSAATAPANSRTDAVVRHAGPWTPEDVAKWQDEQKKQAQEKLRLQLGASDDEWKVLQPKIDQVQTFNNEFLWWRNNYRTRLGAAAQDSPAPAPKPTDDLKAKLQALKDALANKEADPKDIAQKLAAVRDARERVKADLVKMQNELRELLTPRQEAQLFVNGTID